MNRGPELLGASEPGAKKCYTRKEYATSEKNIETLGVGGLQRFPDPVAGPRAPKPHLRSQHFGLPVLALGGRPRELRPPRLLLNQGPSEPCFATGYPVGYLFTAGRLLTMKSHPSMETESRTGVAQSRFSDSPMVVLVTSDVNGGSTSVS